MVLHYAHDRGMPFEFWRTLVADQTNKDQIAFAVEALSHWHKDGLIILHGRVEAAWLFVPGDEAQYISLTEAGKWKQQHAGARVMLYIQGSAANGAGHVVSCLPDRPDCDHRDRSVSDHAEPDAHCMRLDHAHDLNAGMWPRGTLDVQMDSRSVFSILHNEMGFTTAVAREASQRFPDSIEAAAQHALSGSSSSPPHRRQRVDHCVDVEGVGGASSSAASLPFFPRWMPPPRPHAAPADPPLATTQPPMIPVARDSTAQHTDGNVVSPTASWGQPPPCQILPTQIESTPSMLSEVHGVLGGAAQPPSSNALAPAGPAAPILVDASGYHAMLRGY